MSMVILSFYGAELVLDDTCASGAQASKAISYQLLALHELSRRRHARAY